MNLTEKCRNESNANTRSPKKSVCRRDRCVANGHASTVLWFTGLSGAGKSTIAHALEKRLHQRGVHTYVFDGDNVRHGLCADLGFSSEDRTENLRRIAETVKLFLDAGVVCLCAFISPLREDRERIRQIIGKEDFHEIFVRCGLSECERRDTKGYYRMAREGKIKNYTGISSPYEEPEHADLVLDSQRTTLDECLDRLEEYLERGAYLAVK